ncbi:DUF3298 domain-containing protein [Mycobacterium talmoniae]|uniref:DUF3298 domain-containing protein n=1 Tax=Mycobacterium talmoniae TaxID=1858794 RepID=UPI0009F6CD5C|nr:DUF3298 domain-containing protein [Mycobacterium talmoniae]
MLVALALTSTVLTSLAWAEPAAGDPGTTVVPAAMSGASPDGLGTWTVHYQRVNADESPTAAVINQHIDTEANREVAQATWDGSTKRPWTFDATGTMDARATTVSELFVGAYNTDEPHMPMQTVGSVVCDTRSGIVITWDNLFRDKTAGLARLADQVEANITAVASAQDVRDWRRAGQFAPVDVNFRYWIPTHEGVQLHFPDVQFGRGLKVVTVPWAQLSDQIAPEFRSIAG